MRCPKCFHQNHTSVCICEKCGTDTSPPMTYTYQDDLDTIDYHITCANDLAPETMEALAEMIKAANKAIQDGKL